MHSIVLPMFSPDNLIVQPNYKPSFLPTVNSSRVAVQLGYGAVVWLVVRSALYYGARGLASKLILQRPAGVKKATEDGKVFIQSMGAELFFSLCCCPVTYLAGSCTPRFLLDYVLTWYSEWLCLLDRFSPRDYISFASSAFESTDEWNFAFFTWQIPSVVLNIGKLAYRCFRGRRRETKITKVLGVLGLQVCVRAYLCSFSVILPSSSASALEVIIFSLLDSLMGRYIIFNTYPFPDSVSSSLSSHEDGKAAEKE